VVSNKIKHIGFKRLICLLVMVAVCLIGYSCCKCKCAPVASCYIYIDGDTTHKIQISYYDESNNNGIVTDSIKLPCYIRAHAGSCNTGNFFLKICDISVTNARAVIFYDGLGTGKVGDTACSVNVIINHLLYPSSPVQGEPDQCYISSDSLFSYLKGVNYPGMMEISKNSNNCQTIKPVQW